MCTVRLLMSGFEEGWTNEDGVWTLRSDGSAHRLLADLALVVLAGLQVRACVHVSSSFADDATHKTDRPRRRPLG